MRRCPSCDGTGEVKYHGAFGETEYGVCHNCGGRGMVPEENEGRTCPICHGSGELKSHGAFGETEWVKCYNCGGRGRVI